MGAQRLIGHRLLDRDGNSVGKIGQLFFDDQTDQPKWVTVRTGLLGSNENFVPLCGARMVDDALQAAYTTEEITSAPSFALDEHLSVYQEDTIYRHYGLGADVPAQRGADDEPREQRGRHARESSGPDQPATTGTTQVGYTHASERVESVSVHDIADHRRARDTGDRFDREREGVRVIRRDDPDPPPAS